MKIKQLIVLFVLLPLIGFGQMGTKQKSAGLDDHVKYVNETIHGILIVQRLMQSFNQEINKYVDLEGYPLQNFGNEYLPKNILNNREYYNPSPEELFETAIQNQINHPESAKLNKLCTKLKNIARAINQIRFDVDEYMKTHDLENVEELQGVYLGLEKAVKYYDDFFNTQLDIEVLVRKMGTELVKKQFAEYDLAFELTENAKNILRAMRAKDIVGFENKLEAFDRIFKSFAADFISKESYRDELNLATRKAAELKEIASKFYYDASIPKEQKLYGKFYFYHNFEAISTTNKYSNGFVNELNTILTKMNCPKPLLFEEPHYFRVIYPQKLETEEYLTSYDDNIQVLPEKLKERNIVTATHKIVVDSIKLNMRLYDPKIQDGDIVSINYNGDWIIENVSLEKNAKDLKVKLNKVGKNYLLIHAESIGSRPPNTVAISYFYQGKKEVIALEVDLDTSQIIEIDFRSK